MQRANSFRRDYIPGALRNWHLAEILLWFDLEREKGASRPRSGLLAQVTDEFDAYHTRLSNPCMTTQQRGEAWNRNQFNWNVEGVARSAVRCLSCFILTCQLLIRWLWRIRSSHNRQGERSHVTLA